MYKNLKKYLIGLIIVLVLSFIVGALNIKEYSIFGGTLVSSCPYGADRGPNDTLTNFRHICPPDGGETFWLGVAIFSVILVILYTLIYCLIYGIFKLYKKTKK